MSEYIDRETLLDHLRKDPLFPIVKQYNVDGVIEAFPAADVRPVVTCRDCRFWTKQEASCQGYCELLGMFPTGAWFCGNGRKAEEAEK